MDNLDKELLIADKLNSLVLNKEDLLEEAFLFYKYLSSRSHEYSEIIECLLNDKVFIESSVRCVFESTTLAVNSLFLDKKYSFINILEEFLYTYTQLTNQIKTKENIVEATNIFRDLRKEIYSRVISKNKLFKSSNVFDSNIISQRKEEFFNYVSKIH